MQKRSAAADIIRCVAFFFVVSVHFFLNNGFYSQAVVGNRMFVMTIMRSLFVICVPLFITLSGYLLRKKELSVKYYTRISKIIITYILASVVCMVYSVVFMHNDLTFKQAIFKILNFKGAPYSWYIEMYLGLFLMIPFLNILYNNIPTKKWKLGLVITFIVLTSLPAVVNVYNFNSLSWWSLPTSSGSFDKLIPSWWEGLYPVTYYFIGCYLGEYGLKIKRSLNYILVILWTVISGTYAYWRSYKGNFIWGAWCGYGSLFNVVLTVLLFVLIVNANYDKFPQKLSKFIAKISGLCLGGYLVSWVVDSAVYPILIEKIPYMPNRLESYFIITPLVFIVSLILSYVLSKIQLLLEIIYSKTVSLIKKPSK